MDDRDHRARVREFRRVRRSIRAEEWPALQARHPPRGAPRLRRGHGHRRARDADGGCAPPLHTNRVRDDGGALARWRRSEAVSVPRPRDRRGGALPGLCAAVGRRWLGLHGRGSVAPPRAADGGRRRAAHPRRQLVAGPKASTRPASPAPRPLLGRRPRLLLASAPSIARARASFSDAQNAPSRSPRFCSGVSSAMLRVSAPMRPVATRRSPQSRSPARCAVSSTLLIHDAKSTRPPRASRRSTAALSCLRSASPSCLPSCLRFRPAASCRCPGTGKSGRTTLTAPRKSAASSFIVG